MTERRGTRWYVRVFRAWLRLLPTGLGRDAEDDIVDLFAARLDHQGDRVSRRLVLLAEAMADAVASGRGVGALAPPSGHPSPASMGLGDQLASTARDVHYAARSLRKRPTFSVLAVLALGLGIGGTTAMFTIVDGVLLKRLPYENPASIVSIWKAWPSWRGQEGLDYTWDHIQFPWADYLNVRENATAFSDVAAHAQATVVFTGMGPAEALSAGEASGNLFDMLGVRMALGRSFRPDETEPVGAPAPLVILSHQLWDRRFGRDPSVLGTTIRLDDEAYEIVGVLPEHFRLGSDLIATHDNGGGVDPGLRDVWMTLGTEGTDRGNSFELIARLASGRTLTQARDEVQTLMTDGPQDQIARVLPRQSVVTRGFHAPLTLLLVAASILMIIACANVMGLLLGEAPGRAREIAVRSAIGASRGRILRQLITESLLLGLFGAALGVGLAWLGVDAVLAAGPALPRVEQVAIDWRVLLFAAGTGATTGVLFGLLPALDLSRSSVAESLRSRNRDRRARSIQSRVVSAQIALTMVLLVSASLFGRSLNRLFAVEPGFEPEGAYALSIGAPPGGLSGREAAVQRVEDLLAAARSVPGVSAASLASRLPFAGSSGTQGFSFVYQGESRSSTQLPMSVDPSYFETVGIPLLEGRLFTSFDDDASPRVMIVSREWAGAYLDGASPLELRVSYRGLDDWTIIGVVDDVRHQSLGAAPEPTFYTSTFQQPRLDHMLIVRTEVQEAALFSSLRAALLDVDPDLPIADAGPLPSLIRDSEADDRFRTLLLSAFAILATLLAVTGIFGVTARAVAARRREIGIRSALGARSSELEFLILREGLASAGIGVVVGLIAAAGVSGLLAPLLYEVGRYDPVAFVGAAVAALAICGTAAYLPARRVTSIDPAEVITEQ